MYYRNKHIVDVVEDVDGYYKVKYLTDNGLWDDWTVICVGVMVAHMNLPWDLEIQECFDEY